MDMTKANIIPQEQPATSLKSPENIAFTAAAVSAAAAVGGLAYTIGKDLLPRLKSSEALSIQILDSKPVDFDKSYVVDMKLTNLGAHGIYIEKIELYERPSETGLSPHAIELGLIKLIRNCTGGKSTMGFDTVTDADFDATFGKLFPILLAPLEFIPVRVKCLQSELRVPHKGTPQDFCRFDVVYNDLSTGQEMRSHDALFRVRGLEENPN